MVKSYRLFRFGWFQHVATCVSISGCVHTSYVHTHSCSVWLQALGQVQMALEPPAFHRKKPTRLVRHSTGPNPRQQGFLFCGRQPWVRPRSSSAASVLDRKSSSHQWQNKLPVFSMVQCPARFTSVVVYDLVCMSQLSQLKYTKNIRNSGTGQTLTLVYNSRPRFGAWRLTVVVLRCLRKRASGHPWFL